VLDAVKIVPPVGAASWPRLRAGDIGLDGGMAAVW